MSEHHDNARRLLADPTLELAEYHDSGECWRLIRAMAEVAPCPLVHVNCGGCGLQIRNDGSCGCEDCVHPIAERQMTARDRLVRENSQMRQFTEQQFGKFDRFATDNDGTLLLVFDVPDPTSERPVLWDVFGSKGEPK